MSEIRVGEGDDVRSFHIHKDLLTSRSEFFANVLKGYKDSSKSGTHNDTFEIVHWKEGSEGIIELPKDEPEVFETYVQLIYQGAIPIRKKLTVCVPVESVDAELKAKSEKGIKEIVDYEYVLLAELYVLAEKLQDIAAKRSIFSAFIEATLIRANGRSYYPTLKATDIIYAGTSASDPMRAFIVDCFVFVGHTAWVEDTAAASYPQDFLFGVMVGMFKERHKPKDATRVKNATSYLSKLQPYVEKKGA
ncbi:hypothetical protein N0V83_008503 [Neocucurbitaria cava]|uniref:BTB domain-containing protein n=1 Tax=Neocucurbitaria cava TaxID=798079 RepID=A0A9W8Y5A2_9PLEO|nr:hypothetical protein N0V83_008503 [Neocucurbitaria cava]